MQQVFPVWGQPVNSGNALDWSDCILSQKLYLTLALMCQINTLSVCFLETKERDFTLSFSNLTMIHEVNMFIQTARLRELIQ